MAVASGDTFLIRPTHQPDPHLWVVLTDPEGNPTPRVAIVNLTSLRPGADTTVVLDAGDHPFVHHETVVYYIDACLAPVAALERAEGAGVAERREPVSDDLLERIQDGLFESDETPADIKAFCVAHIYEDEAGG